MLAELHVLYPIQCGLTPLHFAAEEGHTTCVEHLISTPGIDVNIKYEVEWVSYCIEHTHIHTHPLLTISTLSWVQLSHSNCFAFILMVQLCAPLWLQVFP